MIRTAFRCFTALIAVSIVAACGNQTPTTRPPLEPARGSPTTTTTIATPTPTPALATVAPFRPTPRPSGAPSDESLPASASSERDGVKLTLELRGGRAINAGNGALALVTIENTGARILRWLNDGCDTNAGIVARMPATWRDSALDVSPQLAPYREWLREEAVVNEPIWLRFLKSGRAPRRFSGCADLGVPKELAPGRKVTQQFTWDGFAAPRLGLPPSGPATLTARFERWSRPGPGKDGTSIEVTLDSWVLRGRPDEYLSPAEVIDAALADDRLASWLVTRPLRHSADAIAEYDRDLGLWAVGLLMYRDDGDPILHAAFLDPVTGEVVAIREHRVTF